MEISDKLLISPKYVFISISTSSTSSPSDFINKVKLFEEFSLIESTSGEIDKFIVLGGSITVIFSVLSPPWTHSIKTSSSSPSSAPTL